MTLPTWITAIIEALKYLFQWKAQTTSPLSAYRTAYEAWEKELRRLEDEYAKAEKAWRSAVAGHPVDGYPGDTNLLHSRWLEAADALGLHRARQPKRDNYRS